MLRRTPTTVLATTGVLLGSLGLGAHAIAAGGLSSSPAYVEHVAAVGQVGTVTVNNTTSKPLNITVTPRPWLQSRTAAVSPNRKKTLLAQVSLNARSFTLTPNTSKVITVSLLKVPASKALYGSIEVLGLPTDAAKAKNGIVAGYSLISSLRLTPTPAARKMRLQVGGARLKTTGSAKNRSKSAWTGIRNNGNTVDPISGTVLLKGPRGTVRHKLAGKRVLPGAIVDYKLGTLRGYPHGNYVASISLVQGAKRYKTIVRSFKY